MFWRSCFLFVVLLLEGCSVVKDVQLSKNVLSNDSLESSDEWNQQVAILETLAAKGYIEAQLELAKYYGSHSTLENWYKAKDWFETYKDSNDSFALAYYRWLADSAIGGRIEINEAIEQLEARYESHGDVSVRLIRLYSLDVEKYRERIFDVLDSAQLADVRTDAELVKSLNRLDDPIEFIPFITQKCVGDTYKSVAYYCLASQIEYAKLYDVPLLETLVEQAQQAVGEGLLSINHIRSLIAKLGNRSVGSSLPHHAYRFAKDVIESEDEVFLLYVKYELTSKVALETDIILKRLERLADKGALEAHSYLGQLYAAGKRVPLEPQIAKRHFEISIDLTASKFHLGSLYLSSKLGYVKLQEGVDLIVQSGRQGYKSAYNALRGYFSEGAGIQPNGLYVHVFSNIYEILGGTLSPQERLQVDSFVLSETQKKELDVLVAEELRATVFVEEPRILLVLNQIKEGAVR